MTATDQRVIPARLCARAEWLGAECRSVRLRATFPPHHDVGQRIQLLLDADHPLVVGHDGLGVCLGSFGLGFLEMHLHDHRVFEVPELPANSQQGGIYRFMAGEWDLFWHHASPPLSLLLTTRHPSCPY